MTKKRKNRYDEKEESNILCSKKEEYINDFDIMIITDLLLHLVRTKDTTSIEHTLHTLIYEYKQVTPENQLKNRTALLYLFRAIHFVRDPIRGLGEYELAYMMIWVWNYYFPNLAKYAFHSFFFRTTKHQKQVGSWKDIKYFCDYIYKRTNDKEHPLIDFACTLMVNQIKEDHKQYLIHKNSIESKQSMYSRQKNIKHAIIPDISLAAKWCPRENKKHGWIFKKIANQYFHSTNKHKRFQVKRFRKFRKILTSLNIFLDTLEIKQCNQEWGKINYTKVPCQAWKKYNIAFMNINHRKHSKNKDRVQAMKNYYIYMISYYMRFVSKDKQHHFERKDKYRISNSSSKLNLKSSSKFNSNSKPLLTQPHNNTLLPSSNMTMTTSSRLSTEKRSALKVLNGMYSTINDNDIYDIVDNALRYRIWGEYRPIIPNFLWRKQCNQKTTLPYFIPLLHIRDVSTISYTTMVSLISRALYISEKTSLYLRNRILLCINNKTKWLYIGKEAVFEKNRIKIEPSTIIEKIDKIWDGIMELHIPSLALKDKPSKTLESTESTESSESTESHDINGDILHSISFLLDSIIETGLSSDSIEKLRIVYISKHAFYETIHTSIQTMFKNAGKRTEHKKEYPIPHIIVWKEHPFLHKDEPVQFPIQKLKTNMVGENWHKGQVPSV